MKHRSFGGWSQNPPRSSHHRPRAFERLEQRCLLAVDPIISEFMANNEDTLRDGHGNATDWIEIYNPNQTPF